MSEVKELGDRPVTRKELFELFTSLSERLQYPYQSDNSCTLVGGAVDSSMHSTELFDDMETIDEDN